MKVIKRVMSNSTSVFEEGSTSSEARDFGSLINPMSSQNYQQPQETNKKRNLPGHSDPDAKVIALSPKSILAKNRFFCEICNKGFLRDQNLQLHRRGHNLPWKLKQRHDNELIKKKSYVCPVTTCVHHQPSRALGDLTGIKKHYLRKHGEKMWKCDKCMKSYAVQSDLKAHAKTCVTKEYKCDCGLIFSGRDNLINHMRFCAVSAERSARLTATATNPNYNTTTLPTFCFNHQILLPQRSPFPYPPTSWVPPPQENPNLNYLMTPLSGYIPSLSNTALLHAVVAGHISSTVNTSVIPSWQKNNNFTRDFLGLTREQNSGGGGVSGGGGSAHEIELHHIIKGQRGVPRDIQPS